MAARARAEGLVVAGLYESVQTVRLPLDQPILLGVHRVGAGVLRQAVVLR